MKNISFLSAIVACATMPLVAQQAGVEGLPEQPNVVIIYADDLGYGDVGVYGAEVIPTPNIDALAESGLMFTDGHCNASTCTPSRYTLMTGQYAFREPGVSIATGEAAMMLPASRPTIGTVMQSQGYRTAAIGKWHMGMGDGNPNWNESISPSVNDRGFDYSYLMAATQDRVPTVYVENGSVVNLDQADPLETRYSRPNNWLREEPTGRHNPEQLVMPHSHGHDGTIVNGIGRIGTQAGGHSAWWQDESLSDTFTRKALDFLAECAQQEQPFMLFYAATEPHVPRTPNPRFVGMTPLGPRGDAIVQFDWQVGAIVDKLDELGLRENTLVIVTSDNGPVLDDGYQDDAVRLNREANHQPSGIYRGGKYSTFEGGTRVPFVTNWPGVIEAGQVSSALVSQADFLPSFAALVDTQLPEGMAFDGENILATFLGRSDAGRDELVLQENRGTGLVLRQGDWALIKQRNGSKLLFDLSEDPSQQNNLIDEMPERADAMFERLQEIRAGE